MAQDPSLLPADSVRAVLHRVFDAPEYAWTDVPPNPFAWIRDKLAALNVWLDALLADHPVLYWILLVFMLVVLAAILTHFGVLVHRALKGRTRSIDITADAPLMVRDARWYLQRSHELRDTGHFADAIAHRFLALVLELDRAHVLTFHPAKTAAEYAQEVPGTEPDRAHFRGMVDELYTCLFGGTPCTADTWAAFDAVAHDVGTRYAQG